MSAGAPNRGFFQPGLGQTECWIQFVEGMYQKKLPVPDPFGPVDRLVRKYLAEVVSSTSVLDIGCETGKNAICLIRAGHKVTLLDIAPNAIQYTEGNLKALELDHGVVESIIGRIEDLSPLIGPFKAVIGTYVFPFIAPDLFDQVMKTNILGRVAVGGYFAGGFFGTAHAWAKQPGMTIVTTEKLQSLFASMNFRICEIEEKKAEVATVFDGPQLFHTIEVIAKRLL